LSPKNNSKTKVDTRERLISTMIDLMWTKGYSAISVDDICKASGAQKGSFYHFFQSKAELAVVSCESVWEECRAELDTIFSPSRPPLERFVYFLQLLYEEQVEKQKEFGYVVGCPYCTIGTELATQDEDIRKRIAIIFEAHLRYFENALRDAVAEGALPANTNVKEKAQEIDAQITGAFATARIKNSLAAVGSGLVAAVFHCLGVPAPRLSEPA
jgi:TetR/AcrR family transcriptional repressor of nem operon